MQASRDLRCSIAGYGSTGPRAREPGYDFILQAESGLMAIRGDPEGDPVKLGVAIVDICAGMMAVTAILGSLEARHRTGRGQHCEVSLHDVGLFMLANVASNHLISGEEPARYGNGHPNIVPYRTYSASDGMVAVAVGNDRQFEEFARVLGHPGWAADSRFSTNPERVRNREVLDREVAAVMALRMRDEWISALAAAGIPAGPINLVSEALSSPQALAREMVLESWHPEAGAVRMLGDPLRFSATPTSVRRHPRRWGSTRRMSSRDSGTRRSRSRICAAPASSDGYGLTVRLPDGLLAVVKRECETCHLVLPVLATLAEQMQLVIASQDDPHFPPGLDVLDDTDLSLSWTLQTETTPTLYRISGGEPVAAAAGWDRRRWEQLSGLAGLGPGLPERRPGCGSRIFEPGVHERLRSQHEPRALSSRRIELGAAEDPFEAMFSREWSDGLPLVPPTPERVERMLAGTTRPPDEVVCLMPPNLAECTVEKVAINAVMAGCRPEYLPVVLAGCRAVSSDSFNIHGVAATTYFSGPVLVVNGAIVERIGMNHGINVLGPGNRANATIGRAVNLVVRNVGGSRPGGVDRATLGSPGKLTFCFGEDEAGSPWEPLSVERGFDLGESTVTVFAGHGPHEIADQRSRTAESLAGSFALQLRSVYHPKVAPSFDALVVVSPEHGRVFREAGWSKARLRDELASRLSFDGRALVRGSDGIDEGIPEGRARGRVTKFRPRGLWFVHAGGRAGLFSGIIGGWASGERGSEMTTEPVDAWS